MIKVVKNGIVLPLLLLLATTALIVGAFFLLDNKPKTSIQSPTQTASQLQEIDTTNWKTYTYKNISFKYPDYWVVIFDSKIAGQPNGFALHAQDENATGYQPDGFYLSTYNGRDNDTYVLNPARKFNKRSQSDSDIQFEVNANRFYSGCAFYAKQETIDICDKILSTFKFTN